ncbi:MAG: hypothetical protein ACO3JL_03190 [Myxococcota bacterium]
MIETAEEKASLGSRLAVVALFEVAIAPDDGNVVNEAEMRSPHGGEV